MKSKIKNRALLSCQECPKDSKTVFVFFQHERLVTSILFQVKKTHFTGGAKNNQISRPLVMKWYLWTRFQMVYNCASPIKFQDMMTRHPRTLFQQKRKKIIILTDVHSTQRNFFCMFSAQFDFGYLVKKFNGVHWETMLSYLFKNKILQSSLI